MPPKVALLRRIPRGRLILSPRTLHIGRDALHRDPSPCEGPFSDPEIFPEKSFSVFSAPRATLSQVEGERVVNPFFFACPACPVGPVDPTGVESRRAGIFNWGVFFFSPCPVEFEDYSTGVLS